MLEDENYIVVLEDFETWSHSGWLLKLSDEQLRRYECDEATLKEIVREERPDCWLLRAFGSEQPVKAVYNA